MRYLPFHGSRGSPTGLLLFVVPVEEYEQCPARRHDRQLPVTARSPAPESATQEPVKKPRSIPWTALIAIVVLGALAAAVLIPSYGDYADRSQVAEAVSLLGGARTPLAEYYADQKKWPSSLVAMIPETGGKYVQSVAITKGAGGAGEIELTATLKTEGVDRRVAGKSVHLLSADGGKSWVCGAGTVPEKTLPTSCRASQ